MRNTFYRINGEFLEVIGTKGKRVYKIAGITEEGIKIEDTADNGVDIVRTIEFNRIKR